jgi:hypothetical protein
MADRPHCGPHPDRGNRPSPLRAGAARKELASIITKLLELGCQERSVSRFEPAGIAAILRAHGFCAIEDINFQEIASRFGRAVPGLARGHAGLHIVYAKH